MKLSEIKVLSVSVVFLFTAGLLSGCGNEPEDATNQNQGMAADEPVQSLETIIEPERVVDNENAEDTEPFGNIDLEEEMNSMEGILNDLSDATSDTFDATAETANESMEAVTEKTSEAADMMMGAAEEMATEAEKTVSGMQEDAAETLEATIVDPAAEVFEDSQEVVTATPDLIRRVQQALANAGYNPGPVDGISGPKTLAAIENFQQDNNLATGELTKETLRMLGVDF
ncbi:Putative peptidoglycan binding domain-containing protein [Nitrosomonas sp. Nm51]|uniref:peptidoglycan-binding domain-containing protein n=1 Tax=Nitrosomonas sp. Nm51 TaxID=133720 RepID=UPI0008AA941F|nr:peptidoglycan-binding protein [Nitrosomonas sp. Nm51]SEQ82244.1 Putative peptidoglycan binding domain-containing protein [Nitrosomonas sp. Nm51]